MNLGRTVEKYFLHLDAGEADKATGMFDPKGLINAPWENAMSPMAFIQKHLESAPIRAHKIMDVLVSESERSAAVHFEYSSKDGEGRDNPVFVGFDHFKFEPNGKIKVLSIYCHSK